MEPVFSQGVGYGVVIGVGLFFAVVMNIVTYLQNRFFSNKSSQADEFTAASRNVPLGLMVVSIVSSWCWSLTLLQSATESYNYGISGSYFYAVGGLIQVSVFSIVASKVKANANLVTTFPEAGYLRFGNAGHLAFLWCGMVCNTIVSACILLGGAAVINAITGMNTYAALYLLPLVCAIYVYFGGLRATFISDALHTFPLLVFLIIFVFVIYGGGSSIIGSPGKMWDLLTEVANKNPVSDNYHGSFLTFRSKDGGIFLFISIITGFGLVVLDQAYWSRAIAAQPLKTSKAYFIGAVSWFVIPWTMGLCLGLAARATSILPGFPPLSDSEISSGLSAVAGASHLVGHAGTGMILLMIFLSVTSSFSGELIATSTLLSYDVYKKYIKQNATPHEVLLVSKIGVFFWAIFAGSIASIFHRIGISMGWLFNFLGCATASGVFPVALTFTWNRLNRWGAVSGSIGGMILAIIVWLVTCKCYLGEINVDNLANRWVSFAGNATALFMGGILSIGLSLIWPDDFDWNSIRNKTILTEHLDSDSSSSAAPSIVQEENSNEKELYEVKGGEPLNETFTHERDLDLPQEEEIPLAKLKRQFKVFSILSISFALTFAILIPVPQIAAPYVYSKKFFTFVIAVNIIWLFGTFFVCVILPLFESRRFLKKLFLHITGIKKGHFGPEPEPAVVETAVDESYVDVEKR
ncbi:sodium:solute symporter family protein [Kluyveromyces lactis]|uniref:KLLA0C18909p n=1 Tax=Kluyveromyces lactis (strain ATCC 8585 / CBS 2359 / DSM 70799 / NBRC 1267 / NRRL Y-1140 / WM37) TaxID=284590 RepID=Q6CSP6_KLULA|nr:uncharacterized protein KLLA0_C18909g [Kluyveromyces lactis]CAH01894.1 KLLA0C18909p [Kluyveromyces lactis]|eukprot:XP_453043.1 uncharacterized protein KLLA0_C18909g [Kluyveromyces lactis]